LATGPEVLIVSRLVQGVGGGMLAATAAALVSAAYPPQRRGQALGLTIMAIYLGLSVGPLVGGLLIEVADWRAIFLVNLPVAAVALLVAAPLHEPRPRAGRPSLDPPGTITLGGALVGLLVGVSFGPLWGWSSSRVTALLAGGAVAASIPPPTPWTRRETMSTSGPVARPAPSDPSANTSTPSRHTLRRPHWSARRPTGIRASA
ncbi:MAG: MFS transporter, partial [Miltoncostaeaceae bacterium]